MTTSEPTTGEIVRALREVVSDPMFRIHEIAKRCRVAADRLESQEREIERLQGEMFVNALESAERIAALTARAEQAEKERDAVVKSVDRLIEAWENFKSPALIEFLKQWRGQPQEGEQNNGQANNDHLR